jgi:hypothetical protein
VTQRSSRALSSTHRDTVCSSRSTGWAAASIFRVRDDDPNRNVIIETLTDDGARTIMAQRFIPAISRGRQAHPDHRRRSRALLPGAHPEGRRDARQPGRRRHAASRGR